MNLGYACINMKLSYPKKYGLDQHRITMNRSMIKRTFDEKGLDYTSELVMKNVADLYKIIQWNEDNGIKFFRMSSETFPWASEYYQDWRSFQTLDLFTQCYLIVVSCKWYGHRLTAHRSFQCIGITKRRCSSEHNHRFDYPRRHYGLYGLSRTPYNKLKYIVMVLWR